jgi:hypothetical protein
MPDAFYRLLAYPNGVAMAALGYSLWRVTRTGTPSATTAALDPRLTAAGVE